MEHLIEPLKNLGLSEKEVLVYLALLQIGSATPYQIAKKSGIKRPTAYVVAEELVKKGLIIHIPGEEKKRYIAKKPDAFFEEQEGKLAAARKILPELRSYQKNIAEKPSILYFEGLDGLRQAHEYRQKELHGKETVSFFAANDDATSDVTQYLLHFNEYREKHNMYVRGVTVDNPNLKPYSKFIAEGIGTMTTKFLPQKMYNSKISIESCDNQFVRIFLFESVETLIIESPKFATAIKEIFELVWKSMAGKYDKPETWVG
jgi:hypothetical protein